MTKGIFIVGTDTDIGKTYVTASIIKKLRENNINAGYYKGALSGAVVDGNKIICDAQYVIDKVGINGDINNYVSYIMQGGYSPHLAARLEGVDISLEKIVSDFYDLKDRFDFITVEGSGGIICPIRLDDKTIMLTDIIKKINLDIIIVASASLGTINSTVLTVEYARSCGLNIKGIILNNFDEDTIIHTDNIKVIESLTGIKIIDTVSEGGHINMSTEVIISMYKEI